MNNPKHTRQVLVVDDEPVVRNGISRALNNRGMVTRLAANGQEALELLNHDSFDLVLLDIRMPDMDGITVLKLIRAKHPETDVIMITGYPTIDSAVHCIKLGAIDYLVKPFRLDDLDATLRKMRPRHASAHKSVISSKGLKIDSDENLIIGQSPPMKSVFEKILKVANTDSTVLVTGESGTGKELVARAIHTNSSRKDKEFVAVDCLSLIHI